MKGTVIGKLKLLTYLIICLLPIRYHASQGVLFSIYIFVVESTVKRNSLFHIQQFFAIYLMYIHIYIALQSPENLYMIFAINN